MAKRVTYSLLDPWFSLPLKALYKRLAIPHAVPPEAIVATGHLCAIAGAVGFALSTRAWWGGLLAALGVVANHTADVLDGTHARATGQCRNGGELLDHFVDPLSFSYWVAGLGFSVGADYGPWLAAAGIIVVYAMAVLTNIRAKILGEFTLHRFGPTEFKTLLATFGFGQALTLGWVADGTARSQVQAAWFLSTMLIAGLAQLAVSLRNSIRDVNALGSANADTTEWDQRGK